MNVLPWHAMLLLCFTGLLCQFVTLWFTVSAEYYVMKLFAMLTVLPCTLFNCTILDTLKKFFIFSRFYRTRKDLINRIKSYKPTVPSVSEARVLLIGPVGAGKSSFFNSINSVFRGHVTSQAIAGSSATGLTTRVSNCPLMPFHMWWLVLWRQKKSIQVLRLDITFRRFSPILLKALIWVGRGLGHP